MNESEQQIFSMTALQSRIIVGAMVVGMIVFGGIAIYLRMAGIMAGGWMLPDMPLMTIVAAGLTVACIAVRFVVIKNLDRNAREAVHRAPATGEQNRPIEAWLEAYQTRTIISAALLEGPGLMLLLAYMLEGEMIALGFAVFLIAGMLLQMPSQDRIQRWLEEQREMLSPRQ